MFWVNVRSTGEEFRRRIFSGFGGILEFFAATTYNCTEFGNCKVQVQVQVQVQVSVYKFRSLSQHKDKR